MRIAQKVLTGIAAASLACAGLLGVSAGPTQAVGTSQTRSVAASSLQINRDKWSVYTTFFNRNGEDVPLRDGDLTFGYRHIQDKHPMNDASLIGWIDSTLKDGDYRDDKNDHTTIVVRDRTASGRMFRVVYSEREAPDGRPVGIITAFLE
ncbi:hypothetical protein [Streptomyces blastmyceticus]|uniref:Uncharacterized protein n=1 Tax=Streptomyces blastmyceticus TaxID=68180 RepID=A0ABP3H869_9ACTN